MNYRNRKGFTLIELLVVVLILGILLAVAIPAYLSSVKNSRATTANSNARAIATAIQAAYVKAGGSTYANMTAANIDSAASDAANVKTDLGGSIPINPCTGTNPATVAGDYTVTITGTTKWQVAPKNGGNCDAGDMVTVTLGS